MFVAIPEGLVIGPEAIIALLKRKIFLFQVGIDVDQLGDFFDCLLILDIRQIASTKLAGSFFIHEYRLSNYIN